MSADPTTDQISIYIEKFKKEHGDSVPVDEVGELVASLVKAVAPARSGAGNSVVDEMETLVDQMTNMHNEVLMMMPRTMAEVRIKKSYIEMDEILKSTETSADQIMDAADKLAQLGEELPSDYADKVGNITTQLFEASTFQDICGQRENKIRSLVKEIEQHYIALAVAVGDDTVVHVEEEVEWDDAGFAVDEQQLLNGPQNEGEGNSQDDIDALLASFD